MEEERRGEEREASLRAEVHLTATREPINGRTHGRLVVENGGPSVATAITVGPFTRADGRSFTPLSMGKERLEIDRLRAGEGHAEPITILWQSPLAMVAHLRWVDGLGEHEEMATLSID